MSALSCEIRQKILPACCSRRSRKTASRRWMFLMFQLLRDPWGDLVCLLSSSVGCGGICDVIHLDNIRFLLMYHYNCCDRSPTLSNSQKFFFFAGFCPELWTDSEEAVLWKRLRRVLRKSRKTLKSNLEETGSQNTWCQSTLVQLSFRGSRCEKRNQLQFLHRWLGSGSNSEFISINLHDTIEHHCRNKLIACLK